MEDYPLELEGAFLAWLNQLRITKEKLTSAKQLKDGVVLIQLLHSMFDFFDSFCSPQLTSPQ